MSCTKAHESSFILFFIFLYFVLIATWFRSPFNNIYILFKSILCNFDIFCQISERDEFNKCPITLKEKIAFSFLCVTV